MPTVPGNVSAAGVETTTAGGNDLTNGDGAAGCTATRPVGSGARAGSLARGEPSALRSRSIAARASSLASRWSSGALAASVAGAMLGTAMLGATMTGATVTAGGEGWLGIATGFVLSRGLGW